MSPLVAEMLIVSAAVMDISISPLVVLLERLVLAVMSLADT